LDKIGNGWLWMPLREKGDMGRTEWECRPARPFERCKIKKKSAIGQEFAAVFVVARRVAA